MGIIMSDRTELVPAGFFDVDGTLGSTNVVSAYLDFLSYRDKKLSRWIHTLCLMPFLPFYLILDEISREKFIEVFHHRYKNVLQSELTAWATEAGQQFWIPRLYHDARKRLDWHKNRGHKVVLISGGLEPILEPLAKVLIPDALIAAQPEIKDGLLTGHLKGSVLSGPRKAHEAHMIADTLGIDLAQSYAYADSHADIDLLETVGYPVAINPDRYLRKISGRRGWPIKVWTHE